MDRLKSAIVGCGAISSTHGDAVCSCRNAILYAVCDIDGEKAAATARKWGCRSYTSFEEILSDENIDVVHICTPHYLHAPMAISAMEMDKHILVEKPMTVSVSDAYKMLEVSVETGKKLGVCFQNRYNATSLRIKEVLESGKTGRVLGGKAFVTWHRDAEYYASGSWRGTWDKEGGGVLINQAIHTLDLLRWFMGDVDKIKASIDTRLLEKIIEVEDTAEATILFKNGSAALFYATNCYMTDSPVELELVCENAIITLKDHLTIEYKSGETEHIENINKAAGEKAYWGKSHKLLIDDFYNSLVLGRSFAVDGVQGMETVKMINAIYSSAASKKYFTL